MVLRKVQVEIGAGVRGAAEHVFSVAHATLGQLVFAAECGCVLELADAALIFWTYKIVKMCHVCNFWNLIS